MNADEKNARVDPMDERIARLMHQYGPGDRVRAVEEIVYASGEEVAEGTVGTILRTGVHGCTPLVTVAWSGRGGLGEPPHILKPCSAESLAPAPLDPG
jgi:hypothetical protein